MEKLASTLFLLTVSIDVAKNVMFQRKMKAAPPQRTEEPP